MSAIAITSKTTKPKSIKYPCGCLIHLNGPEGYGFLNICKHYCKPHAARLKAMKEYKQADEQRAKEAGR